jgi:hypothetical protein
MAENRDDLYKLAIMEKAKTDKEYSKNKQY